MLFVIAVATFALMLAAILVAWDTQEVTWTGLGDADALYLGAGIVMLALSVSLSLALCRIVLALQDRFSTLGFTMLVVAHLVLLLVWLPITQVVAVTPGHAYILIGVEYRDAGWRVVEDFAIDQYFQVRRALLEPPSPSAILRQNCAAASPDNFLTVEWCALDIMGLVGNALRLYISALFAISFIAHRVIGNVAGRLWANFVESEWPIFTTLFVTAGALWVATSTIVGLASKS